MSEGLPSGVDLTIDRHAAVRRVQLSDQSWVDVVERFVGAPDDDDPPAGDGAR